MKTQEMKVKPASGKSTVVYEVNDEGRESEYSGRGYYGTFYIDSIIDFLRSLGYEVSKKSPISTRISINGVEFDVDCSSASFMGYNAFSRVRAPRNPKNRFVALDKFSTTVVRVRINQELDQVKLKSKINAAIQADLDRVREIEEKAKDRISNIKNISHQLTSHPLLRFHVTSISMHYGKISLWVLGKCKVDTDASCLFKGLEISSTAEGKDQAEELFSAMPIIISAVKDVMRGLSEINASDGGIVDERVREFLSSVHGGYYDVVKDKAS